MSAYYFDPVESDGKIKFVKRGGAVAAVIQEGDMAAHEHNSSSPDTLIKTRQQELELPAEYVVKYLDADADYKTGAQMSQRQNTRSINKEVAEFAISLTSAKAKEMADVLLYNTWTARTAADLILGYKYAYLEPTDVIQAVKGGITNTLRIADESASLGIFKWSTVADDPYVYTQSSTAGAAPAVLETVTETPLTDARFLDIPLLRDVDDDVGFYIAAAGFGAGWDGAQVFKSSDNGASWLEFGNALLNDAFMGAATTILGAAPNQFIFDETASVTVVMSNGELVSETEINVLNGANAALLGDEIIQFRTATLISANTYTLTGLLRGLRGTNWATTTHAVGDRFILLDADALYLTSGPSSEYDVPRLYKAVSFDRYIDEAAFVDFTHTAVARHPYSPVQLGGGRNAALDITLTWVRRTRVNGGWNNYADVSLGEATEAYEVEIYTTSGYTVVARTITGLSTPTATYTAAQQTTDFGSAQATVYFKVFQISAAVGRGYEAKGVV